MKILRKTVTTFICLVSLTFGGQLMAQTTIEQNKQLLADFGAEVLAKKDLSNLSHYMKENYIQHNPLVEQGSEGFKQFFTNWFNAVPDWNYSVIKLVAEGDTVWVYGTYSGTQQGEWLGIPASNKAYSITAVDIFRVEDGKLAEHWDVIDVYGLFTQLGVIK